MRTWLLVFILVGTKASAQIDLVWKKTMPSYVNSNYGELTAMSKVDKAEFVAYKQVAGTKSFPGLFAIDADDSLVITRDISLHSEAENLVIKGLGRLKGDTIIAFCDDYKRKEGKPCPHPVEMEFRFKDHKLDYLLTQNINLSNAEDVTAVEIKDVFSGDDGFIKLAVLFSSPKEDKINMIYINGPHAGSVSTFNDATSAKFWYSNDKELLISVEKPFVKKSAKKYYQLYVLNEKQQILQQYPDTKEYLDSLSPDRLVSIEYRAPHHIGFLTRQVRTRAGENKLNWFGFNGLAKAPATIPLAKPAMC